MDGNFGQIMNLVNVYLLCRLGGIKPINVNGVLERVDQFFQPGTSCLVTDQGLSLFWRVVDADKGLAPLRFVVRNNFFTGKIGVKGFPVDTFGVGGFCGD